MKPLTPQQMCERWGNYADQRFRKMRQSQGYPVLGRYKGRTRVFDWEHVNVDDAQDAACFWAVERAIYNYWRIRQRRKEVPALRDALIRFYLRKEIQTPFDGKVLHRLWKVVSREEVACLTIFDE